MKTKVIIELLVFMIILLLTYASSSKIFEFDKFTFQLGLSPFSLLSKNALTVAVSVLAIEVIIVVLLIFSKTRFVGLASFISLMATFSGYILIMLLSGVKLPCTCGGILSKMGWNTHLYFNLGYMIIGVIALILHRNNNVLAFKKKLS